MRVIPKSFTGYICGQYNAPNGECFEGVMYYESGQQMTLFVAVTGMCARLYRKLVRLEPIADLTAKIIRVSDGAVVS